MISRAPVSAGLVAVFVVMFGASASAVQVRTALRDAGDADVSLLERRAGLSVRNVTLETALTRLTETSGVIVAFSPSLLRANARMVTCDCKRLTVGDALDRLLGVTDFGYTVMDGGVALVPRPAAPDRLTPRLAPASFASLDNRRWLQPTKALTGGLRLGAMGIGAQGSIIGRVTDANAGSGVARANIRLRDTRMGTITDEEGRYRLADVPVGDYTLIVERIGYGSESREVTVVEAGEVRVDIALDPSAAALAGIVVTGSRIPREGFEASTPVTVVDSRDITRSGAVNIESLLANKTQFVASTNGGATANTVPGGTADVNLRGFGPSRNLVLVNGRRFAIYGPEQVTDLNTIPSALIERTEIVTGGSSAVYGSDAINGVVNFIMRDDFEGVEGRAQTTFDAATTTPISNLDLTAGGNFAGGRGNAVISVNYLDRGSITRGERGDWAFHSLSDGCVSPESFSEREPGVPMSVPEGMTCPEAGGVPGLIAGGSGDIPNGRFTGIPLVGSPESNPDLDAALIAAGLGDMRSRGFTFDNAGLDMRPALTPEDDFNLGPDNYLQVPQERWMINTLTHYDFHEKITGNFEFHFSNNRVNQQLAPTNINGPFLFDVDNPYVDEEMREVLRQLDLAETEPATVVTGTSERVNRPNDGFAVLNVGRRLVEVPLRFNTADRNVWRAAAGLDGVLGDLHPDFMRDLSYDVYYTFAQTSNTSRQAGNVSRSRFAEGLLSSGESPPLLNIFGQNISQEGVEAVQIGATNVTEAELQVAAATLAGEAFDLPAGPVNFSLGTEWRKAFADHIPDEFLSSGDVVGFNPGQPTGGEVSAKEVFGELRVPLFAGVPLIQGLTANGAFRFSDYNLDGVGGVWTYLGGADWRVDDDLAFRGQYQRAIRAPNVADLFGGLRRSVEPAVDPCSDRQPAAERTDAVRAVCIASGVPADRVFTAGIQSNNIIEGLFGGNPDVGEERSDTYTLGAVLSPSAVPGLALSVDYFNITLDGAISALGGGLNNTLTLCFNVIQDIDSEFCQAVQRNPSTGEISGIPYAVEVRQANTGALETAGVDFEARYAFDVDWGLRPADGSSFDISASWTWTDKFTSTPVQAFADIKNHCVGAYGRTCGEPIPELKGITRVTWNAAPLSLSLRHRFLSAVTVDSYLLPKRAGNPFPDLGDLTNPRLDAQNYLDFSFGYDLIEDIQLYGGVRNVLGNEPPVVGSSQVRANTWPATYDYNGRELFLGTTVRF